MGILARLRALFSQVERPQLTPSTPGLVVVAAAFDPAEADSAVLARSADLDREAPAVLRHHLLLPADRVTEATSLTAQDGYELRREGTDGSGRVRVSALRVQHLDALHCAQERSRMAGLAQRLGGDCLGWDALQPGARETDNIAGPDPA